MALLGSSRDVTTRPWSGPKTGISWANIVNSGLSSSPSGIPLYLLKSHFNKINSTTRSLITINPELWLSAPDGMQPSIYVKFFYQSSPSRSGEVSFRRRLAGTRGVLDSGPSEHILLHLMHFAGDAQQTTLGGSLDGGRPNPSTHTLERKLSAGIQTFNYSYCLDLALSSLDGTLGLWDSWYGRLSIW